jgi:hypothetical protein
VIRPEIQSVSLLYVRENSQDKEITMFSAIVTVCAWVGISLFMWSVSDSLATIAKSMHRDASPTTLPSEVAKPS